MKKIVSIILAVVLAASMFSVTAFASRLRGDVNNDGKITAVDARMILQVVAELRTAEDVNAYDINYDGSVSAVDARIILQYVAGLIDRLPTVIEEDTLSTKGAQLSFFVSSFNNVKVNAKTATRKYSKVYNYNNHVVIHPVIEGMYDLVASPGDPSLKDSLTAEINGELVEVNEVYTGDAIDAAFPPANIKCNLKSSDISAITFRESGGYYLVEITVKGKKNPERNESVGNVATIVTKEDFESEMSTDGMDVTATCDYKDAVVKAKIEKATGNMVEYSVDCPSIITMDMMGFKNAAEIGMGTYEEWYIAY